MRECLRRLIERDASLTVIGEAENGHQAVKLAKALKPDVALVDVAMPDMNGVEATCQIKEICPQTKVVALSMHTDRSYVSRMLCAGACGYLSKDCASQELITALHSVVSGRTYLSPKIASVVVDDYVRHKSSRTTGSLLTDREKEVLRLLTEGLSTKAIAEQLQISIRTVETHRSNIMSKANAYSLAELTKFAVREGLSSIDA
jgi:DNA-binding NarL/FixJ family response regulator